MAWFFCIVKDHSGEISMTCGRVVVEAETKEGAIKKLSAVDVGDGCHKGMLTHGPYVSKEVAETAPAS